MDVKPICPWCGREMHLFSRTPLKQPPYWYNCPDEKCFGSSPVAMTKKEALAAALRRPLQKPLTLRELHRLIRTGEDAAIYCEAKGDPHAYATIIHEGMTVDRDGEKIPAKSLAFERYGKTWRAWHPVRPTDEEREAAPWEDAGDADL